MDEFREFEIGIDDDSLYPFNTIENEISSQDIDNFFELRKPQNKDKLVVLRADHKDSFMETTSTDAVSILWSVNYKFASGYTDYVGPKTEQYKMESHLREYYKQHEEMVSISVVEQVAHTEDRSNIYLWIYKPVRVLTCL